MLLSWGSGEAGAGHHKGVEGYVVQEAELKAEADDAVGLGGAHDVLAAGAEVGEGGVGGAGELDAGFDESGVKVCDAAKLDFEAELDGAGGGGGALKHPAAGVGEGLSEGRDEALAVFVAVSL